MKNEQIRKQILAVLRRHKRLLSRIEIAKKVWPTKQVSLLPTHAARLPLLAMQREKSVIKVGRATYKAAPRIIVKVGAK